MFEGYQFWQPSREEDHPTKSQFPKFGAENWEDTYALEAYPLVNIHSLLLKPWPSRNSWFTMIYPLIAWWFSSSLCKRLPEGI
jgi:hypothetical protein